MSLPIILDKSTFQSLGHDELIQLHRYYIINVTPLLVSEILGDLSKEEVENKKLPKEVVISLANKIFPSNTYVNTNYKKLLELSLLGNKIELNNRPFLEASKSINTGKKQGLVFEETEDEKSIRRWKDGNFNSIDEIMSWFWRTTSKDEEVVQLFKNKMEQFSLIKLEKKLGDNLENLKALRDILFIELNKPEKQQQYLSLVIDYFELDYNLAAQIFYRWETEKNNSISNFAPYAFYCISIAAMYYVGINNKLFSERKTNLLDLEYLYYTPCCRVFSSNDKFLIFLFELINPKNVFFINSNSLKGDLNSFHKYQIETGEINDRPPIKDTETYRIWDKVFDLKLSDFLKAHPKSQEELRKEFEEILNAAETGKQGAFDGEPDFVTKNTYMRPTDPCVCGSGKQLKECCLLKENEN
ncbi:SEC-C domain-containing protein [Flavobacterium hibernum]|uniref:SEC-C motif-containing protein n=1 Tax=Flavobacterium hibernum TaxID=37752 RepID=A0A0D0EN64_9FLAO|nr:SEC-C domain-containing protein [Flavobacterium hibernum]KIO54350.1 hypothetical protein IW18_02525 [Flavobacterium hibernum]OXA88185.1 hypothetical protein B0A73_10470 [Flavobacterium hibernum]STO10811.1 Uncharacterised protein [Flavobacterium hibernum]